ncbi:MAG: hypothetical protein JWO53_467 [Chlamydiia bacterium]|nr:hypothetical protein [Chlamydiia bacterium]
MHYYIDGYNLLFRSAWNRSSDNLEAMRQSLIEELDKDISLLHLVVTIVFDAPLQTEELRRGHFRSLEIIFTSKGQTADDFLIHSFEGMSTHATICLVSSDKRLQARARNLGVIGQSIEEFTTWLRKRVRKKQSGLKNEKQALLKPQKEVKKLHKVVTEPVVNTVIDPNAPLPPLSDLLRWEKIFTERFKNLT